MAQLTMTCPRGHQWTAESPGDLVEAPLAACPVCATEEVAKGQWSAPTIAPSPETSPPAAGAGQLPEQFGRYRILKQLGQGGMGAAYLAYDSQLDRKVALKVPRFAAEDGSAVVERFHREARAAAMIHHPNLCPVFDVGELGGIHFLTMAYLEGKPLADFMGNSKSTTVSKLAFTVYKLALALEEAHKKGLVHRDLKPANVMITKNGPVIIDFGLARRTRKEEVHLTQAGTAMGTPAYMPPEQVRGDLEAIGPGCDIYSLGVILYEMLAGRRPFQGTVGVVMAQILNDAPAPPSTYRPELDPELDTICLKAMAKGIMERYTSMAEFAAVLHQFLRRSKASAREDSDIRSPLADEGNSAVPSSSEAATTASVVVRAIPRAKQYAGDTSEDVAPGNNPRRRWAWLVAGGTLLSTTGLVLFLTMVPQRPTPPAPLPPPAPVGSVALDIDQAGAEIFIDGKVATTAGDGRQPVRVSLEEGTHDLKVTKTGFEEFSKQLAVKAGANETIKIHLTRIAEPRRMWTYPPLAGTNWVNSNGATFRWFPDGSLLHAGKPADCVPVDASRVAVLFANNHVDVLVFNQDYTTFEQWNFRVPDKPLFTGRRRGSLGAELKQHQNRASMLRRLGGTSWVESRAGGTVTFQSDGTFFHNILQSKGGQNPYVPLDAKRVLLVYKKPGQVFVLVFNRQFTAYEKFAGFKPDVNSPASTGSRMPRPPKKTGVTRR